MGVAALAIGAVVAGGAAAYSASEKNKTAKKGAAASNAYNEEVLSTWEGIQKHNSKIYSQIASAIPDLGKLDLGPATEGFRGFNQQRPYIKGVAETSRQLDRAGNKNFQAALTETSPDLLKSISQLGTRASEFLSGDLPPDVEAPVRRKAAEGAIAKGFGAESGMGRNLVARDLGLTSLDLIGRGASMVPGALSAATAVNPWQTNVSSLFFTPEYLQTRKDAETSTNWSVGNENKNRQFQRISGMLGAKLKSMPPLYKESIPETTNPWVAGIGAAASSVAGGVAGGMGAGGASAAAGGAGGLTPGTWQSSAAGAAGRQPANNGFNWTQMFQSIVGGVNTGMNYNG